MACGLCEQHLVNLLNCLARFPDGRPVSQQCVCRCVVSAFFAKHVLRTCLVAACRLQCSLIS